MLRWKHTRVVLSQGQTWQGFLGPGRGAGFALGGLGANRLLQASVWLKEAVM